MVCRSAALFWIAAFGLPARPVSLSPSAPRYQDDSGTPSSTSQELNYINQGPARTAEIGNFYFRKKRYRAALSRYEEATSTDPNYAPAYLGMGQACEKLGFNQRAVESYRKYLDLLPSDRDAANAKNVQRAIARLTGGTRKPVR